MAIVLPFAVSPALAQNNNTVQIPAGMPPPIKQISPSAPMNLKERASAALAERWRNRPDKPIRGEDGSVQWVFGSSLPSVVCSPLYECDLALQPGEVINGVTVGDKVRWRIAPFLSGSGSGRITHLVFKPIDAGLVTNLLIYTDKRQYSVKLLSTQKQWTPMTSFIYPDDQQYAWENYRLSVGSAKGGSFSGTGPVADNLSFFKITGDDPVWKPLRAYTDGRKTYIDFPESMQYSTAPALMALDDDSGLFRSASHRTVNFRTEGARWVIDSVETRLELISGVGSRQIKVELRRTS
jgi:type IV secretion system protein VirB9